MVCRNRSQARRVHKVITRRDFWHNAAEFFVLRNLRRDFTSQQLRAGVAIATTQNRNRCFVAGSFEREYYF